MRKIITPIICVSLLAGCAQKSANIQAAYVSPLEYQSYSCKQIEQELSRVSRKVSEISGAQDKQASGDAVAMGVGLVIFWPALFFLIGDDKKEELSRLKGEYDALEQSAIQKNCSIAKSLSKAPPEPTKDVTAPKTKQNWN